MSRILPVCLTLTLAAGAHAQVILAESHFDSDLEGWYVTGDPAGGYPRWEGTMGCVPGCIRTVDAQQGGGMGFHAPAAYLGDMSAAYDGRLSFCIRNDSGDSQIDAPDITLQGAGIRLVCRAGGAEYHWQYRNIILDEATAPPNGEWYVGDFNGPRPTRCEFLAVLSALEDVSIRAEFRSGADDVRLDEVQLVSGAGDCPGDLDYDGVVSLVDLTSLLVHFGERSATGDLDCDGDVDLTDLTTMLGNFGQVCP